MNDREFDELRARAEALGIKVTGNATVNSLSAKIAAAEADDAAVRPEQTPDDPTPDDESADGYDIDDGTGGEAGDTSDDDPPASADDDGPPAAVAAAPDRTPMLTRWWRRPDGRERRTTVGSQLDKAHAASDAWTEI